ncbi:MAG: MFS transporter [Pseudomonadota bacterium]
MIGDLRTLILSIAPLLVTIMLVTIGHGLIGTGTTIRLDLEGISTNGIGMVGAAYAVGFMLGTLVVPKMIGRVGHIRVFAAFACLFLVTALTQSLYVGVIAWAALRFVAGFCIAGVFTLTEGWINESTSNAVRGQVLSIYVAVNYFGVTLGQGLIAVIDPADVLIFITAAILISVSVIPLSLANIQAPTPVQTIRFPIKKLFRLSPLGFFAVIASGVLNSILANFLPVWGREIDPTNSFIALIMLTFVLSGFLCQFPAGRLSDMIDRRYVLIGAAMLLSIGGIAGLALPSDLKHIALTLIFITGALIPIFYSVGIAHTTDFIDFNDMVAASAGLLMVYGLGTVIGPLIGGQLLTLIGAGPGIFISVVVIGLALSALGLYRNIVGDTVEDEDKGDFQIMRPTSTLAFSFDPRIEEDEPEFDFGDAGCAMLTASAAGLESPAYLGESTPYEPTETEPQANPDGI